MANNEDGNSVKDEVSSPNREFREDTQVVKSEKDLVFVKI